MEKFLKRLEKEGMQVKIGEGMKDYDRTYDATIRFPEVSEPGMFLLGKVKGNEIVIHQRTGMDGANLHFGSFEEIEEEKIQFLKTEYFKMKDVIQKMNEEMEMSDESNE